MPRSTQSNRIWLMRISLSQRWVLLMCRIVPDLDRMTTLEVLAPSRNTARRPSQLSVSYAVAAKKTLSPFTRSVSPVST